MHHILVYIKPSSETEVFMRLFEVHFIGNQIIVCVKNLIENHMCDNKRNFDDKYSPLSTIHNKFPTFLRNDITKSCINNFFLSLG